MKLLCLSFEVVHNVRNKGTQDASSCGGVSVACSAPDCFLISAWCADLVVTGLLDHNARSYHKGGMTNAT